MGLANWSKNMF